MYLHHNAQADDAHGPTDHIKGARIERQRALVHVTVQWCCRQRRNCLKRRSQRIDFTNLIRRHHVRHNRTTHWQTDEFQKAH